MKHESKDLLLKYLCMALPYGAKIKYVNTFCKIKQIVFEEHSTSYSFGDDNFSLSINDIQVWKLYLRPMSSMSDEEKEEYQKLRWTKLEHYTVFWLLENHFDFMGLIPKGLAIEVNESNNPYENNM